MQKQLLSLFLAVALMFTTFAFKADAATMQYTDENGIKYSLDNESFKATVSGVKNKEGILEVTIPESITFNNVKYSVTSIGDNVFFGCNSLTTVNIPGSVESIGDYAFTRCSDLTKVTIQEGVKSIGEGAFAKCESLTEINIPSSVEGIGDYAFYSCNSLAKITIQSSETTIGRDVFLECSKLTSIVIPCNFDRSKFSIAGIILNSDPNSYTVAFNKNIEGTFAFKTDAATEVQYTDENGIKYSLDNEAFKATVSGVENKENILEVTIPESITFNNVTYSVTSIDSHAFEWCISLTTVNIAEGVKSIGDWAFAYSGLTEINIPSSVKRIGNNAFTDSGLTKVTIPEGVKIIEEYAFSGCKALTTVNIPSSVTHIGMGAFGRCKSLTKITIPSSVKSIGDWAFAYSGLTKVTIPESVKGIGDKVFLYCEDLSIFNIPNDGMC